MINNTEFKTINPEDKRSLTDKLNQMALERIAVEAKLEAEKKAEKNDPAVAVLKAYIDMDKTMMKVVDEHIERVRKSSERNKELYKKLALKKDIEKRDRKRKEHFDEAAENAEALRKFLKMKG